MVTRARTWLEGRPFAIPLTEVEAYARMKGWGPDEVSSFLIYLDAMEDVYFAWAKRETKKSSSRNSKAAIRRRK